jgi:glutathione S-transferase
MLTFYAGSGSPFVWKVWLALEHKRIAYDLRMLSFDAGDLRKPEFLAINPHGKVPAIVDDGFALYESSAIVEYLEEAHPGRSLLPTGARDRATARRLAAESQYLNAAVEKIFEELLWKGAPADPAVIAEAKKEAAAQLARLPLGDHWLVGDAPSVADYAVYPFLAQIRRVEQRFPAHEVGSLLGAPARAFMARVEALPYCEKTTPPHWRSK